jgi:hypothetical protein
LESSEIDVIRGNFAEQGHQRMATILQRRLDRRVGRFNAPPHAAEYVDFPAGVEAGAEKILFQIAPPKGRRANSAALRRQ